MENDVYIMGDYVSGIAKRPDLANQPCALICKEEGFIISVLVGDKGEPFKIPYDIVESFTYRPRVIVTEKQLEYKNTTFDRDLLAGYLLGPAGIMFNHLPAVNNYYDNVSIGKIDYSNLFEVVVEYRTPERNRRLIINVYENPSRLIEYFNTIKK